MVSLKDIAQKCGVSIATVSKSLNDLNDVSAETKGDLVGKTGEVLTELRPSGSILLEGSPVDVVSEGAFLEKGEQVQVIAVQGSRVIVRKVG